MWEILQDKVYKTHMTDLDSRQPQALHKNLSGLSSITPSLQLLESVNNNSYINFYFAKFSRMFHMFVCVYFGVM